MCNRGHVFRILVVCTANICRSPAAATLLRRAIADSGLSGQVSVESAGIAALDGSSACDLSSALVGEFVVRAYAGANVPAEPRHPHRARRVTADLVMNADLVVGLDQTHLTALTLQYPRARPRTFTLRQAARLSGALTGYIPPGQTPPGSSTTPAEVGERLRRWVAAMDSVRDKSPRDAGSAGAIIRQPLSWHDDDVPDPHVLGYQLHGAAMELIEEAVMGLTSDLDRVVAFGVPHRAVDDG